MLGYLQIVFCFMAKFDIISLDNYIFVILSRATLQEQLRLSALLNGIQTDLSPSRLWDSNQQPFGYCPTALNH